MRTVLMVGGRWVRMILSIDFCTWKSKQVVFSTLVFSYDEQEVWLSPVVCSCKSDMLCCSVRISTILTSKKSTQTWSPSTCTEVNCSDSKTVTELCPLVRGNKASVLPFAQPTIPAVCSTLVMCFLCPSLLFTSSSSCHTTWWYSLVPKKEIKLHPSATFDVLNQAFMLPYPSSKSVFCHLCTRAVECPYSSLVGQ